MLLVKCEVSVSSPDRSVSLYKIEKSASVVENRMINNFIRMWREFKGREGRKE